MSMGETLVSLAEMGRLLEPRVGRVLTRQEVRWLIARTGAAVIEPKSVVVEVLRAVPADGIAAASIDALEAAYRQLTAGDGPGTVRA